ncbi:protein PRRC2C isoform X3 [Diachasma alloeum]|uniref:protein PRRC2C isoform X3 n=1 Tax=Diachasma alloeum TaxID=454923 RepID=UPI00073831E8|nr:protein PRRC2C isoform X3 [Diachasma alloeum]
MSTLSGIVSKGEKGKSKFQSLDINSLYRVSRGESLEQHQQKSTLPRKHGMQSLGKVPSARRPPANLPSLKSEYSSSDPAVSLVPSGGSGWATTKEPASSTTTTSTNSTSAQSSDNLTSNSSPTQCVAATTPASTPSQEPSLPGQQQNTSQSPHPSEIGGKSSWSAIMTRPGEFGGASAGQQQQQSQQNRELNAQYGPGPSLRPQTEGSWIQGGSRTPGSTVSPATGNGSTPVAQVPQIGSIAGITGVPLQSSHQDVSPGIRANLGQSPVTVSAQAGQNQSTTSQNQSTQSGQNLHHYRGLIPQFMCRGNFPPGGFPSQFPSNVSTSGPRPRFNNNSNERPSGQMGPRPGERDRSQHEEEMMSRPIIKEEDLTRMDDISHEPGWAAHDDIDYNQKLAFSDDEPDTEAPHPKKEDRKEARKDEIKEEKPVTDTGGSSLNDDKDSPRPRDNRDPKDNRDMSHRPWQQPQQRNDYRSSSNGPNMPAMRDNYSSSSQPRSHSLRGVEEEEIWNQRRKEQGEKVASAVERARQRKEEEEKRFQEQTKQAAAKKLQDLENKIKQNKAKIEDDPPVAEPKGLITVPPVAIPVPEWERERENRERESRERSRTSSEGKEEKPMGRDIREDFTRGNFMRQDITRADRERERDRDQREQRDNRDRDQPAFSRQFQSNLPPRFQKQQAERGSSGYNRVSPPSADRTLSSPNVTNVPFSQQYDPGRWSSSGNIKSHMGLGQRRNRADSDHGLSSPLEEEPRPPSRDHVPHTSHSSHGRRDDRFRPQMHHLFDSRKSGYHDDYRGYKNDHEERHGREFWERDRDRIYEEKMREVRPRDSRDFRERDSEVRDVREKDRPRDKDYEKPRDFEGSKEYDWKSQGTEDDRERSETSDWSTEARRSDERIDRRERDERIERSERPQRPDSRDSRASRESRTSQRDDEHKSTSWAHEMSDYEEKRWEREEYRERERDRRAPPGPITREKLQADDLKVEKRQLTQLKRLDHQEKKESPKEEVKKDKEPDVWGRKLERTPEAARGGEREGLNCAWADAVSPTFEKNDEKIADTLKDDKEPEEELKESMDKLAIDKREELDSHKEEAKDDKREKNVRNRTNSGSGSSSRGRETRGGRTWGGYNMYSRWRGPESRGRRGTGSRSMGRPGSAKSGSYGAHTDSDISGDEISGSVESGKEDRRSTGPSKTADAQKSDKDERNREVTRREDKRSGDYGNVQVRSGSDKRPSYESRPREGFAPSGEPSRRGRGGARVRGSTLGARMEGYGPPPSKSPFSSDRNNDDKQTPPPAQQNTSTDNDNSNHNSSESADDKIIAKQQALTAGITGMPGRRAKSPNHQSNNQANASSGVKSQKKDDKRTRSGSRRRRENRDRIRSSAVKQNSSDVGNEEWETTSENSEEHGDEHKESRGHKPFPGRQGQGQSGQQSRRNEQMNNRDKSMNKPSSAGRSAPGQVDKRPQGMSAFPNQRNHFPMSMQPQGAMQPPNNQNGRPRSQGSANSQHSSSSKSGKETTVNRVDEIKLNDANLVDQVLKDIGWKGQGKEKKQVDIDGDINSYLSPSGGDDGGSNSTEDMKLDTDGFQEVRSKKNLKDPSRHGQKDEAKPPRREKDKDKERDRSKSKSNGQPTTQQVQNIPPLLGQPIPQPANMPPKAFDRNPSRQKLAPRFQKQKLARQQAQQQGHPQEGGNGESKINNSAGHVKDSTGAAAPPSVNAWDKPFTSQMRANSPNSNVPADIQLMSGLTGSSEHSHEGNDQVNSSGSSQRNSPSGDKAQGKGMKETIADKNVSDTSSPPVQTLIFENTNYSKTTKTSDMAIKSKFSNHMKHSGSQQRVDKREIEEEGSQLQQQQQALAVAFANKLNEPLKEKNSQDPIQMPLSFNKTEDNADMKLDFTFDADLSQLTDDKSKGSLGMPRSMHMTGGHSTISPSTAELNLKIASVKKVWENAPMPTVVEHEDGSVVSNANSFPQSFETTDVDDSYSPHQQYNQTSMKNEITTSTNVCKVKPQQQSSGGGGAQANSTVPGPNPIGPGQSPIGHPPASIQAPLSPPPFNSTGQPSHMNYQEFPQYPGSQAAQYGSMSAIPSPPAVLFNTGSGQLPAQAGGLYGAFQLDQSRSPFTQYPPYAPSLQSSFNQQNVYLQQAPPPPHAQNPPAPDMYQSNLSQYRIPAAAAPPFGQNQQLSNNPNTVLISSSSNSLMSASVKPSSQPIGAIGTKAPHFQAQSAPQPNQLAYIPYDPSQVLGVSGNYMGNSQLVQRQGPSVQPSANSYYSATSAGKTNISLYVFPGSQTGFYQPGGAGQQTGTPYGLQGFGQHSQSLATPGNATPVGLQNFSSQFLSGSGLQIAAAAAAQQFRNPTGGLPGPANAAATFLSKHQQQEQPRQLKSPSGNQQDVLASVFSSTPQIPSPKSRNCKQQSQSQQPQPSPTQHHKYPPYQGVSQSAMVSSYSNYLMQQNVRGMGMPPRGGIQPSQQRYPPPIQRPVVPFPPGPNPNNPNQQQQNCMPNQQQNQMNRHRPNIHQQQRNMKMQQQYYSGQGNVKIDQTDKNDSHNDKITDPTSGNQSGGSKASVTQQEIDTKEEVNQQTD